MNATTCQPVGPTPQPLAHPHPGTHFGAHATHPPGQSPALASDARPQKALLQANYAQDYAAVASYLFRRTGDRDLASELTSETFAEALRSIHRWSPQGLPLRAWLLRIATRRLSHHRRRHGRRSRLFARLLGAATRQSTHEPAVHPIDHTDASLVRQAISRLRPAHQDALVLHHVEGMSIPEIALTLELPEGTVKSRLARARAELHGRLTELGVHL